MFALIKDNKVVELSAVEFEVHPSLIWRAAPEGCAYGWVYHPETDTITAPEPEQPTLNDYKFELKLHLTRVAQQRDYDDEQSICSYATSVNLTWKAEAETFIAWRDTVYEYAFLILSDVETGNIPAPSLVDFINALPVIIWP